ncbi:MAG TPA: DUF4157 domain-containing protein [Candidatus Methylomirabilis sp.]|nr:DUF4157 domain-containing protein [Candidatus Methylomirabilis sp.]
MKGGGDGGPSGILGAGHDLRRVPVLPGGVRPKLVVGGAADPLEREADRAADRVMRMPAADALEERLGGSGARGDGRTAGMAGAASRDAGASLAGDVLQSVGQPLDAETRAYFEPRFGHDLSRVRVHTGSRPADSAVELNARAYSRGMDIVFGPGGRPGVNALTAHELAHVVQGQSGADAGVVRGSNGFDDDLPTVVEPRPEIRGHVEKGGEIYPRNEASGEIDTVKKRGPGGGGGVASKLEGEGAQISRAESAALKLGSLLEAALPGPLDVLGLWIGFFGSIAEAQAKLREESYRMGFAGGMAANLLGFGAAWVNERLITHARTADEREGFKGARAGGNNEGVVGGYRFVRRLTSKQRIAFLKQGFGSVMATRGPTAMNPDHFDLDDVIVFGIAMLPTVDTLLEVGREQQRARERASREKFRREHPETRGHGYFQ